jgi:hypothetical protein
MAIHGYTSQSMCTSSSLPLEPQQQAKGEGDKIKRTHTHIRIPFKRAFLSSLLSHTSTHQHTHMHAGLDTVSFIPLSLLNPQANKQTTSHSHTLTPSLSSIHTPNTIPHTGSPSQHRRGQASRELHIHTPTTPAKRRGAARPKE